ncbi:MAG: hypothetical protein VB108_11770 [Anaerolineaceae bacterium]|nr:hypothetical protein [Anaerolineaceae bacterium]
MKRKLILFLLIFALLLSSAACTQATPTTIAKPTNLPAEASTEGEVLELLNGPQSIKLSMADLKALPAVEGLGGIISSTGKITAPVKYKGVEVVALAEKLGGLKEGLSIEIQAQDGYSMTFSAEQLQKGQFTTYDVSSGTEIKALSPIKTIIAYEREGQPMDAKSEGALRLAMVSDSPLQVVDGHWAVKWVVKVILKPAVADWSLHLAGAREEDMDRGTFESGSAANCHGGTWKDDKAQTWKGIPLYMLLGRIDDENKHGDNAFREDLAKTGYSVDIIGKDGYTVTLDSAKLSRNEKIIVANQVNGNVLSEADFPLKLVGEGLTGKEMVGAIAKLVIHLPGSNTSQQAATAVITAKETAAAVMPTLGEILKPPAELKLEISGLIEAAKTFDAKALLDLKPIVAKVEHPKMGSIEVTGIKLADFLNMLKAKAEASKLVVTATDGYVSEIPLKDVLACPNCLLGWNEKGLMLYMPGFQGNAWAKNVAKIEIK